MARHTLTSLTVLAAGELRDVPGLSATTRWALRNAYLTCLEGGQLPALDDEPSMVLVRVLLITEDAEKKAKLPPSDLKALQQFIADGLYPSERFRYDDGR